MKPTVADEMFPEGPPYAEEDASETTVFQQVHADFYRGREIVCRWVDCILYPNPNMYVQHTCRLRRPV